MAKEKKKKQNTIYFTIKLSDKIEDIEEKIQENQIEGGTSIYAFYDTYVYVPFNNKIKEKDYKALEEALKQRDYSTLTYRPEIFTNQTMNSQNYGAFMKMDKSIGKYSWIYMSILDYIYLIESIGGNYDIGLNLSVNSIVIPQPLWDDLKLLDNQPLVEIKQEEDNYSIIKIEDQINMSLSKAMIAYRKYPTNKLFNDITQQLDEANTTVYFPIDLKIHPELEEQFSNDLQEFTYSTTLTKTIFDSVFGKVVLVYTSKVYIPEELLHKYTWVSMNFMDMYRILRVNKEWDYFIFNYLNKGFRVARSSIETIYTTSFALGNIVDLNNYDTTMLNSILYEVEEVETAYLYEAYNRRGVALLYQGNIEPEVLKNKIEEFIPGQMIFVNKVEEYDFHSTIEPFYQR